MVTLPVKSPCNIAIIGRITQLLFINVVVNGYCCWLFSIQNNRLIGYPLWKLVYWIIGWVTTRTLSLGPASPLGMALLATLVKNHIWPGIGSSTIAITIATVEALKTNPVKSLVKQQPSWHSVFLLKWNMVLILLLYRNMLPLLWMDKVAVLTCSFFYKGLIFNELLWLYVDQVTHTTFLNEIYNLLVLLNRPKIKLGIRSNFMDASCIYKMLRLKGTSTLKALSIDQYCITSICNILPWVSLELETLQIINSLLHIYLWI